VTHEVDGPQAVWEWVYKRPQVIREPRYASPIMMSPDAYQWVDEGGISSKMLGRFTEDDVNIQMVRWDDAGTVHHLGPNRTTLTFVLKGAIAVADQACAEQTAVWSDFEESHELIGEAGAEVICFGFPIDHAGRS
jgi:redox-sensitive bicupin YhaK (pirin superfamily)